MTKSELDAFLTSKPGYTKFGSKALREILKAKGHNLTMSETKLKEVLRNKVVAYKAVTNKNKKAQPKVMTYDIETSMVTAHLWGTGKQFVRHDSLVDHTKIITVAWKWIGSDQVKVLKWDKKQSDKKLMETFLKEYNKADMVIGFNNNSFDNKIVNSRALHYGFEVDTLMKSYDLMRMVKSKFRLASYSMAHISTYLGLGGKMDYGIGIRMWKDIQFGSKKDAKASMKLMVKYNRQDVTLTEELYFKLRQYLPAVMHVGVMQGKGKSTCPTCGGKKTKLHKTMVTAAGSIQRVMKCKTDNTKFKLSNAEYLKTL
jgi:DNA polymerase elongation subunit (family B)